MDNCPITTKKRNFFEKLPYFFKFLRKYWNTPPKGKYLSYKEYFAYCIGGMGVSGGVALPAYVALSAGLYMAAALRINVNDIVLSGIISSIITILRGPIISMIMDNTNSKLGKFRPWLVWLPIPIILSFVGTVFIPAALQSNYLGMFISFIILYNVLQFFISIYSLSFNTLVQVISPSPEERTQLMSFGSFVYSLGPSLVHMLFPLIANYAFSIKDQQSGEILVMGINTIEALKWIIPIFALICFALGLYTALGTKERMVIKKNVALKVKFFDGVKHIAHNKFFWIITLSGALGVFRLIATGYTAWLATYYIKTEWSQTILITIMGTANVPGMLLAPMLIKKFGKKKISILSGVLASIFTIPIVIFPQEPYLVYAMSLIITFVNGVNIVISPALMAQINDYQQYKTGDRLEGFITQFSSMILTSAGIAVAYIVPFIYRQFGYINDTRVLYDIHNVTSPIIRWTSLLGVISSLLYAIPYVFWNLSEKRHNQIMQILAIRRDIEDGKIEKDQGLQLEEKVEKGFLYLDTNYLENDSEEAEKEKSLTFGEFVEEEIRKKNKE